MTDTCVAVFVGTRADLSPLSPVIAELDVSVGVRVVLLTGVAFGPDEFTSVLASTGLRQDLDAVTLAPPLDDLGELSLTAQGAALSDGVSRLLAELRVDVLVVLGDRWELLYVVPSFFLARIPVVHLHGGEVTEGALDDRVRHAMTKLADQHCAATRASAARLQQMGEPAERVHLTGAPGLDRLHRTTPLDDAQLETLLGVQIERPLALFTYHPALADPGTSAAWADEALRATLSVCGTVVATYPGFDTGREAIITVLKRSEAEQPRLVLREQLGADYPAVLASCDLVVGNSSSGIIEAPGVGVPSVDIGERQGGRERSPSVVHCSEGEESVTRAVREALDPLARGNHADPFDPFGDGLSAARVRDVVLDAVGGERRKPFVDHPRRKEDGCPP